MSKAKARTRDIEAQAKAAQRRDREAELTRDTLRRVRRQLSNHESERDTLWIKRNEDAHGTKITAQIETALRADDFEGDAVRELTCPANYPVAVAWLMKCVAHFCQHQNISLAGIIASRYSELVLPYRLGLLVGLAKQDRPFHRHDLVALAPRDERARFALAAMGEIDWNVASHCERAAALLRAVILTRLGRAAS
jgi:hypothetical protein